MATASLAPICGLKFGISGGAGEARTVQQCVSIADASIN